VIYHLIHAEVLAGLATIADDSVDAVITDPPYGLGFMGKEWDTFRPENVTREMKRDTRTQKRRELYGGRESDAPSPAMAAARYDRSATANRAFQAWCETWARECLRVLKPGGYILSFGGSRTYHRMASGIEDAGFEVRDQLQWIFGSGFPKSLDVSKAVDRHLGAEPRVVGARKKLQSYGKGAVFGGMPEKDGLQQITEATTTAGAALKGWGTALKPAHEPIVLARKPFRGTVAANVLQHGTGAMNIDGCRIDGAPDPASWTAQRSAVDTSDGRMGQKAANVAAMNAGLIEPPSGRWPANVLLDEEAAAMLDEQSGELTSGLFTGKRAADKLRNTYGAFAGTDETETYGDSGGASRFFYTAKASRSEREEGLYGDEGEYEHSGPRGHALNGDGTPRPRPRQNSHPTVKPFDVMRWLVRLITPTGGHVLDPFVGSGTTGMAAIAEGFDFTGIDREAEYIGISRRRIASVAPLLAKEKTA